MLDKMAPPEDVGVGWIHSRRLVLSKIIQWSWPDGNNASDLPTSGTLNQQEFAKLFMMKVACRYGLPIGMVAN
jgi:hypothetical protein